MDCNYYKKINRKAFTLVEMLVVLGIFSFIMTLATGVLYTTQAVNVKLQETQAVLDNVSLSMETISRDIRYGADFHCGVSLDASNSHLRKSCSYEQEGGSVLFFKPSGGIPERVAYYASTTQYGSVILRDEYMEGATSTFQITANDVRIKSLIFYVSGANTASTLNEDVDSIHDFEQPVITLTISGETIPINERSSSTKFTMQSSVSPRELDK
jgi:prepilin-type N-terminal cleavage/methylation domain-containing protein